MTSSEDLSIVTRAAAELEHLRKVPQHDGTSFPRACRKMMLSLPGNSRCVDCGNLNPDWASVSYGVLLCVRCSGRHRSYGVAKSRVRSISMDAWSHTQVLAMLEGGNEQLQSFFQRHQMGNTSIASSHRYHTKAAEFYRTHLDIHARKVGSCGLYGGRSQSRKKRSTEPKQTNSHQLEINQQMASKTCREKQVHLLGIESRRQSITATQ